MNASDLMANAVLPESVAHLLRSARSVTVARGIQDLEDMACGHM